MRHFHYTCSLLRSQEWLRQKVQNILSPVKNNPSSLLRRGQKKERAKWQDRKTAGELVLIKYYHSVSFHAGSVMKYSALRNPYSTSCYGILSDLFWEDILTASRCIESPPRRNSMIRSRIYWKLSISCAKLFICLVCNC